MYTVAQVYIHALNLVTFILLIAILHVMCEHYVNSGVHDVDMSQMC